MTNEEAIKILKAKTFDTQSDAHVELTDWHEAKSFFTAFDMAINALSQQTDVLQVLKEIIEEYKSRGAFSSSQSVKDMEYGKQLALTWVLAEIDRLEAKTRMESEE